MRYVERRLREIRMAPFQRAFATPYEAGMDCALSGPNPGNCHFTYFATPEMTAEWTRGRDNNSSDGVKPPMNKTL